MHPLDAPDFAKQSVVVDLQAFEKRWDYPVKIMYANRKKTKQDLFFVHVDTCFFVFFRISSGANT
jgi:hypothetical protein